MTSRKQKQKARSRSRSCSNLQLLRCVSRFSVRLRPCKQGSLLGSWQPAAAKPSLLKHVQLAWTSPNNQVSLQDSSPGDGQSYVA